MPIGTASFSPPLMEPKVSPKMFLLCPDVYADAKSMSKTGAFVRNLNVQHDTPSTLQQCRCRPEHPQGLTEDSTFQVPPQSSKRL